MVGRWRRRDVGQIKCEGDSVDTSKNKPDLLSGAARAADRNRILAQLEHGVRPQASIPRAPGWNIDGWTIGLCLLLLVMCSAAWLMHDRRITPETFRASSTSVVHRPAATSNEAQAAAIINEQVEATVTEEPVIGPRLAHAQSATQPQPARASATPAAATPRAGAKAAPTAASDTDVTLLTALVAHASKPATVAPERSRDVVERQDGDSTAQLLARCKQLGLIEGMLCRSRICTGRWESDEACRAPEH